jgi:hypothetical protein
VSQGYNKVELAVVIVRDFAIGLLISEVGAMPGSASHSLGVVWDSSASGIQQSNRPYRRFLA